MTPQTSTPNMPPIAPIAITVTSTSPGSDVDAMPVSANADGVQTEQPVEPAAEPAVKPIRYEQSITNAELMQLLTNAQLAQVLLGHATCLPIFSIEQVAVSEVVARLNNTPDTDDSEYEDDAESNETFLLMLMAAIVGGVFGYLLKEAIAYLAH